MQIEEGKFYRTRDGRKVGPMRRLAVGGTYPFDVVAHADIDIAREFWRPDGTVSQHDDPLDLVAEWTDDQPAENPFLRTVTRKEIVRGKYGDVCVLDVDLEDGEVQVKFPHWTSAADLRALAVSLTQLADAMDEVSNQETGE